MIQVVESEFKRDGVMIGYVKNGDAIYNSQGKERGYVSGNDIYDASGKKVAWVEGDYVKFENETSYGSQGIRLEDNTKEVFGGAISDVLRAAARIFLG